jgi:hypothetical protein
VTYLHFYTATNMHNIVFSTSTQELVYIKEKYALKHFKPDLAGLRTPPEPEGGGRKRRPSAASSSS